MATTAPIHCSVRGTIRGAHYPVHPNDPTLPPHVRGRDDLTRLLLTVERHDDGKLVRVEVPSGTRRAETGERRKLSALLGADVLLEVDPTGAIVSASLSEDE